MMIYALIFVLLLLLELSYFRIAKALNITDKPNERSSHTTVTLRGGGIVFLFSVWLYAAFFGFEYIWFLTGLTIIGIVSFIDDVRSLPDSVRLVAQFISMLLMFSQFGIINFESWWMVIIALIVCVGITNAYNFMDGINGITGGYTLAVLLPLLYLNHTINFVSTPLLVVLLLGVIVFNIFNFRKKAVCFAGDVGSVSIAFVVVFLLGKLMLATNDFSYIVLLALYGVDTVLTIIHRIMLHENLGQAHRKHAYQLMANELGLPHIIVASIYALLQFIISAGFIFTSINRYLYLGIVVAIMSCTYIVFMRKYYHLHAEYLRSKI